MVDITLVQSTFPSAGATSASPTVTLAANATAGNILVIPILFADTNTSATPSVGSVSCGSNSFTISAPSLYTITHATLSTLHYGIVGVQFAYCEDVTDTSSATITIDFTGGSSSTESGISALELTAGKFDSVTGASSTASTTNPSAGSLTPSANGAFLIAQALQDNGIGNASMNAGSGWTAGYNLGVFDASWGQEYQAQSAAAAVTGNFSESLSGPWVANVISFIPSGGPTPNPEIAAGFLLA